MMRTPRLLTGAGARAMLPPSRVFSPLDARAVELGAGVVETAFRENGGFQDIAGPFHRFFAPAGRDRAGQALKKALHMIVQDRLRIHALRADPPSRCGFESDPQLPGGAHPLDGALQAALPAAAQVRPGSGAGLAARSEMLFLTASRAARLCFRAVWTYARHGCAHVARTAAALGAPAAMGINGAGDWTPLQAAARQSGLPGGDEIYVVDETGDFSASSPHPVVRIADLPVPRAAWRREAAGPSLRLAAVLLWRAVTNFSDPWRLQLAHEALVMAEQSLPVRRLCMNYRFKTYLDVEEYTQRHIVKAMVFEAAGGRLARWAHSVLNNAGIALDFCGYHDFLAFGPYEHDTFGRTWPAGLRSVHIGMVKNDRRMTSGAAVSAHYRALAENHKKSGGRIFVYFLPSAMFGMDVVARRTLEAVMRQMALRRGWLLIVKPKGRTHLRLRDYLRENERLFSNGGANAAVFVEHGKDGKGVCGSGWLLRHLDMGAGFSTAQLEALCLRKPVVQYYPVLQDTPFFARMRAENLAFDSPEAFEAAAGRWMDSPVLPESAAAWGREQFDPFCDDDALARAADFLFAARRNPERISA